ncbi:MAG: hypothetical protein A2107_06415 [Verrucomicrobia bacterium GWF2_62_7]|nr:MAG: hypothetical protein A2107_06415 [Verrucomicrobia bacterium GWF2_62_7]
MNDDEKRPLYEESPALCRGVKHAGGLLEKLAGAALAVAAAWLAFRLLVGGIFSFFLGRDPDNAVYLLFYGGGIVLLAGLLIGGLAGSLLWRRTRRRADGTPAAGAQSYLGRGLTLGLMVVVCAALLLAGLFIWILRAV